MSAAAPSPFVVLLASVLKPTDDTRMHGKFAFTIGQRPHTQVHLAGRAGPASATQHPIFSGSRLGWGRLLAQGRYWRLLRRLRPALVVVHAPELLPLTLLWQRLGRGRQFIYDIRENYALNVRTQQVYGRWLGRGLAAALRWVEGRAARRAAALTLAEASYAAELPFLAAAPAGRVVVLENKYQPAPGEALATQPRPHPALHEKLHLLFSGTISELNGVWEAVALTQALATTWPGGAHCTIVGFCQQPELLRQLQAAVTRQSALFSLVGGSEPVPHARIVAEIGHSHLGLLPYRPHPSTEHCQPTKLFEYLAHGLPLLIPRLGLWAKTTARHGGGIVYPFTPADAAAAHVRRALEQCRFYPNGPPAEALWASEGKKLGLLLDAIV